MLPEWRLGAYHTLHYRGDQFTYALQLLEALWRAQHGGRPLRLPQLHNAARTGQDRVERILREMERSGWVSMTVGGYWMLSRNPQEIRIIDVYRLLVFDPPSVAKHAAQRDARIGGLLDTTTHRLDEVMDMTLEAFFTSRTQESPTPDVDVNEEHVRRIGVPSNES
jgi:DNA-binding IscR family transcriptional regulator